MEFIKGEGLPIPIKSWCRGVEDTAMVQAENLARHPALRHHVALMPDCHCGIGMPIGGVIAAKDAVIPAAVGVDIGCGMIAVETDIPAERLEDMRCLRAIHSRIKALIPAGEGKMHQNPQEWTGFEEYLDTKVKGQLRELLTNYGQVSVIWFDTPKSILPEQSRDLCSFVHSLQPECLVSGRIGNGAGDYDSLADNQVSGTMSARPGEGLGTMNESWGYKPFDLCYRTPGEILRILCEMASSSTNYLLNVSPGGDGSLPVRQKEILAEIGSFLSRYGEALYGSEGLPVLRPFSFLWGGVTRKKGSLYFWIFRRFDSKLFFYGLRSKVHRAWIPGGSEIAFQQEHRAEYDYHKLILHFPDRMPLPCVIRVECNSDDLNEYSYSSADFGKD